MDSLLDLFIGTAAAQDAAPSVGLGGGLGGLLLPVMLIVVFYFLLIRPQQKKAKEHRTMLGALQKGDEVVTAGGMIGRVTKLSDQYATVEIAPGVETPVQRSAIAQLLPKGTIKTL